MSERPDHHITKDGSSTLYSNIYNQYFHNPNGSVSESKYVFFETPNVPDALVQNEKVTIFETGFGTGLNFLLMLDYYLSAKSTSKVEFHSVEAFPISADEAEKLNFASFSEFTELGPVLKNIFSDLKKGVNIIKPLPDIDVTLFVFIGKFEDFNGEGVQADFFFHDAFSPEVNEELWTPETFRKLKSFASAEAVLSTYCAASKARAAMAVAGWKLAKARGALGKREMTIASLYENNLTSYKRVNEERLIERFNNGDFDR
ncbi:MAG: tRNA (5-methylaminomethyl-2-thiouridine)(34)-methyltransferase MnmD [Balneola sp.]|jgi:tRNA U34 5-methylaminomethyl-2-thiouridine-forming methyltransferase MnmC